MTYTLAHVWSGVRSRLRDPNAAEPAAITIEANNAVSELRGRIKKSGEEWIDVVETTDVLSGKDVYPYPDAADQLKMVERLDLVPNHGVYASQNSSYFARQERDLAADTRLVVADTVTPLPGRQVQLKPMPSADFPGGLRWTFLPKITQLQNPSDSILGIPEQFFEWIIVATIDRIRQFRGIELSDPQAYEQFRKEQTMRLERELRPKELMQPNRIIDEDEYYFPSY